MTTVTVIMRGDQYALGIVVKHDGIALTPSSVRDMKFKIGNGFNVITDSYAGGTVTYDFTNGRWLLPLTAEQTKTLSAGIGIVCQAQAIYPNGEIRSTAVMPIEVRVGLF